MGNIYTSEKNKNKYKSDIKNMITISRDNHIYENTNEISGLNDPFLFFKYTPQIKNNSFELDMESMFEELERKYYKKLL